MIEMRERQGKWLKNVEFDQRLNGMQRRRRVVEELERKQVNYLLALHNVQQFV